MAVLNISLATACVPYRATCAWLEPADVSAMEVVASRKVTAPQECTCQSCSPPGQFRLQRNTYSLEFWNGDRWYPELLVRARSLDGTMLRIQSDQLRPVPSTTKAVTKSFGWSEFDYYADVVHDSRAFIRPERLRITVLDSDGQPLGTEDIALRFETRRHWAVEGI